MSNYVNYKELSWNADDLNASKNALRQILENDEWSEESFNEVERLESEGAFGNLDIDSCISEWSDELAEQF